MLTNQLSMRQLIYSTKFNLSWLKHAVFDGNIRRKIDMTYQMVKNFLLKMPYEKCNVKKYLIYYCNMENFGSFLFKFGINIRKAIRSIESTDKKWINAELAL